MHGAIEQRLIAGGIPFFVEKPVGIDLAAPNAIAAQLDDAGIVVGVGYMWRALDFLGEVRQRLAERPAVLVNARWLGVTPSAPWWRRQDESGGQIAEQTTHLIDLARHLVGPMQVLAGVGSRNDRLESKGSDVIDTSVAVVRFRSGAIGTFSSTALLAAPLAIGIELLSDGMAMTVTQDPTSGPAAWHLTVDDAGGRRVRKAIEDPFLAEDRVFLDAVRRGDPTGVVCTYRDALESHRLALELADAVRRGPPGEPATERPSIP
jgi:predicted dehydrogenase